jgi:glycosyltransferase involved in cell wall biosynthesis
MTEHVKKEHPELTPEKFVTLSNGFDPEDFSKLTFRRRASGPVLFSYVGAFYYGRTPEPFLRALKSGIDEGMLEPRDIRVRFVGNVAVAEGQVVSEMIRQLGLEEMVSVHPPVSRDEALRQTVESDVLLVLDEMHPIQIPLKLYEGLAAGPVILNIGSRGAVSEVLARTGKGLAVDHAKVSEIRDGILQSIRRSRSRETQNGKAPWLDPKIQEFNFVNVSRQLASLLEGLGAKS